MIIKFAIGVWCSCFLIELVFFVSLLVLYLVLFVIEIFRIWFFLSLEYFVFGSFCHWNILYLVLFVIGIFCIWFFLSLEYFLAADAYSCCIVEW